MLQAGAGVTHVQEGDAVYGMLSALRGGISADRIMVPAHTLQKAPSQIDLVDAAAIPLAALTSLQSLRDHAKFQADQTVLINGASGGVGTFGIQIANILGGTVVATCSDANRSWVEALGAKRVIDYREQDFTEEQEQYDGVYDVRGNRSLKECARVVKKGGWVVTTEPSLPHLLQQGLNPFRSVSFHAVIVRTTPEDLTQLGDWVDAGRLTPVIEKVYEKDGFQDAYTRLRSRRARGKLVIRWRG